MIYEHASAYEEARSRLLICLVALLVKGKLMSVKPENRKRDQSLPIMQKVGAAIVQDKRVLVVRKKTRADREFVMAGGKMEGDETQRETLDRELYEELGVIVTKAEYLGSYEDLSAFKRVPLVIHAYKVQIKGRPEPHSEIKEYAWIDRDFEKKGIPVSSIMAKQVIPELIKRQLL